MAHPCHPGFLLRAACKYRFVTFQRCILQTLRPPPPPAMAEIRAAPGGTASQNITRGSHVASDGQNHTTATPTACKPIKGMTPR